MDNATVSRVNPDEQSAGANNASNSGGNNGNANSSNNSNSSGDGNNSSNGSNSSNSGNDNDDNNNSSSSKSSSKNGDGKKDDKDKDGLEKLDEKTDKQADMGDAKKDLSPNNQGGGGQAAVAQENQEEQEKEAKKQEKKQKKAAKKGGSAAAGQLAHSHFGAAFLSMLKAWLMSLCGALINLISNAIGMLIGVIKGIAIALGITFGLAGVVVGIVAFAVVCVIAVVIIAINVNDATTKNDASVVITDECTVESELFAASGANLTGNCAENAKKVYSILHEYGLSDTNIAGILGNWSVESGIDTTGVEGVYDTSEDYSVTGPKKSEALKDLDVYCTGTLFPMYANNNVGIDQNAFLYEGKYYCGLGLGQWTGIRCYNLLNFASSVSKNWWDLDLQIAFMLKEKRIDFSKWAKESTAAAATETFMSKWESVSNGTLNARQTAANQWYTEMATWTSDVAYANSVIEMSGMTAQKASDEKAQIELNKCSVEAKYDNNSIAKAAASYAYINWEDGKGNDGTDLYKRVHKAICPSDVLYQSCDRGVAYAVLWSGADNEYPTGDVAEQYNYLVANTEQWKEVEFDGDWKTLQPGDVLIKSSGVHGDLDHTILFTGFDAIKEAHPEVATDDAYKAWNNEEFNTVSASFGQRSPGCMLWSWACNDWSEYKAFRCVKQESEPKYKNAGLAESETESETP